MTVLYSRAPPLVYSPLALQCHQQPLNLGHRIPRARQQTPLLRRLVLVDYALYETRDVVGRRS